MYSNRTLALTFSYFSGVGGRQSMVWWFWKNQNIPYFGFQECYSSFIHAVRNINDAYNFSVSIIEWTTRIIFGSTFTDGPGAVRTETGNCRHAKRSSSVKFRPDCTKISSGRDCKRRPLTYTLLARPSEAADFWKCLSPVFSHSLKKLKKKSKHVLKIVVKSYTETFSPEGKRDTPGIVGRQRKTEIRFPANEMINRSVQECRVHICRPWSLVTTVQPSTFVPIRRQFSFDFLVLPK